MRVRALVDHLHQSFLGLAGEGMQARTGEELREMYVKARKIARVALRLYRWFPNSADKERNELFRTLFDAASRSIKQ